MATVKAPITEQGKLSLAIGSGIITAGTIKLMGVSLLASSGVGLLAAIATGWFVGKATDKLQQDLGPTADGQIPAKQGGVT